MFFCGEESGVQSCSGFELSDIEIKLYVSFNELCGLITYFLPYDGSECTRVTGEVLCS